MVRQDAVKNAIIALASGDVSLWEQGYYNMLCQQTIAENPDPFPRFEYDYANRKLLYAFVNNRVIRKEPIDYFEFGVYGGQSFRNWLDINTHEDSRFYGFDSFEGLPEAWENAGKDKGHFSRNGSVPNVKDNRAAFIKGWFQESLRPFLAAFEPKNRLVLHMDADLYSSTLFALMHMDAYVQPGTIIFFDEFVGVDEFAAFYHYCKSCMREWKIIAARNDLVKLAVEITK